mmetsp:Transcript_115612/g.334002  ORF Transcript_115612/g.334002 Transcript_115612/m.334002 type:complete len:274 (+) Transcript_115612:832-1653(+)
MPRTVTSLSMSSVFHTPWSPFLSSSAEMWPSLLLSSFTNVSFSSLSCARFCRAATSASKARYSSERWRWPTKFWSACVSSVCPRSFDWNHGSFIAWLTKGRCRNRFCNMDLTKVCISAEPRSIETSVSLVMRLISSNDLRLSGLKGLFPVRTLNIITPMEKTSPRGVQRPQSHTSGGMYPGVPPTPDLELNLFARPKSITITCGLFQSMWLATITFGSFRSEWTTPLLWRNSTPISTWYMTSATQRSSTDTPALYAFCTAFVKSPPKYGSCTM